MADDPVNQKKFAEDVAAATSEDGESFMGGFPTDGDFKMPSAEEVWKLIEQMDGISDEERENLRKNLFNPQDGSADDFMKRLGGQPTAPIISHTSTDYMIFTGMIAIVVLVFALFGYKLYKSLMDRELKKKGKLKTKQSKKSKKAN